MSTDALVIATDNRILYFGRDRELFGFLYHFHPAPIRLDGEVWPTVEHHYQVQMSPDPAYRQAIRDAELVEDSPLEPYWGIGPDGQGSNWAGRVIMEVREQLRGPPEPAALA